MGRLKFKKRKDEKAYNDFYKVKKGEEQQVLLLKTLF
jgi:hypothetical protein